MRLKLLKKINKLLKAMERRLCHTSHDDVAGKYGPPPAHGTPRKYGPPVPPKIKHAVEQ